MNKEKRYYIPKNWNELNEWQLSIIGKLLYENKPLDSKVYQILLLFILIIEKPGFKSVIKAVKMFRQIPFIELKPCLDFIFDVNDDLTKFTPVIKVGGFLKKKLFGPGVRLSNISIQELSYADTFYYNWLTKGDPKDLQRLVACLYRPSGSTSSETDRRKEFDKLLLPVNAKLTDQIPMHKQYIIALAYQGTRRVFRKRYKSIFPEPPKDENGNVIPQKEKKQTYQSFSALIQTMAMDDVQIFGNLQTTEKTNAVQFLEVYDELLFRQRNKR